MKLFFLFFLSALLLSTPSVANTPSESDSLKNRIEILLKEKTPDKDALARLYSELAQHFAYISHDSSRYYLQQGFRIIQNKRSAAYVALTHSMGEVYFAEGKLDSALIYYKQAFRLGEELAQEEAVFQALCSIGIAYRRLAQTDSALFYYNRAVEMTDRIKKPEDISYLYTNIAVLYSSTSREEALDYASKAVEAAEKSTDLTQLIYARNTKGALLSLLNRHQESIDILKKNIQAALQMNSPRLYLKNIPPILMTFEKMGRHDSTDAYMKQAEGFIKQLPERSVESIGFFEVQAILYRNRKAYDQSIAVSRKLLQWRDYEHYTLNKNIADNYADKQDYKQAFLYMEKSYNQLDSAITQNIQEQMSDFTIKYQTKEKELEIARLQQEELIQKNAMMLKTIWFGSILFLLLIFISLLLYWSTRQKRKAILLEKEKKMQEEEFERLRQDTSLRLARKYIDGLESERERLAKELHDGVCNDLLGLDMRLKTTELEAGEKEKISGILQHAYANIRSVSHALIPPSFMHASLEEMLDDYITHLNKPDGMQIELVCSCEIDWEQVGAQRGYEFYRIIQEALGNVIKHARATRVEVVFAYDAEELTVSVIDNGVGFADSGKKGIGIYTIRERVCSMGGTCDYSSGADGTTLLIKVKIH